MTYLPICRKRSVLLMRKITRQQLTPSRRSFALSFASSETFGLLIVAFRPPALHHRINSARTHSRMRSTYTLPGFLLESSPPPVPPLAFPPMAAIFWTLIAKDISPWTSPERPLRHAHSSLGRLAKLPTKGEGFD